MEELIRKSDATKAVEKYIDDADDQYCLGLNTAINALKDIPAVDVVECGECKHLGYCSRSIKVVSPLLGEYDEDKAIRYHLEFCSFGERKDNE